MVPEAPDQRECKVTDVQRDLGRLEARQDSQDERLERIEAKVDQLTPNFTLRELTRSDVATRMGKSIEPTPAIQNNLARLCLLVLEPIRAELGMPVRVLSGYRPIWLNTLVGGSAKSEHVDGRAADIEVVGMSDLRSEDSCLRHRAGRAVIPQAWLVGILGALLGVAGAGWQGYRMGKDSVIADQAREDKVRQETRDIALATIANAISRQKQQRVTIDRRPNVRSCTCLAIALLLTACSSSLTRPSPDSPSPLVRASCPPPVPMTGATFADFVRKVQEQGEQYRECRAAIGL